MQARRHGSQLASPAVVTADARRLRALDLRRNGLGYAAIASELGVSLGQAHADVQAGLKRIRTESAETAEELLSLELARLDRVVELATAAAEAGDTKALGVVLRAVEVRVRLLGLDARPDAAPVINAEDVLAKLRGRLERADAADARIASA